ncbi:acyl carrier protein [Kutzneria sp. NPDC052558]|uniref:acyl carrier protein n=1 Tax=Kutzneria sp. NPDC052558 TaxID=3364121 RepID=UPI0037CCBAB5
MTTQPIETAAGIEDEIVEVLSELLLLDADQIDRSISFGDIGVDSILAVEFVAELRSRFDIVISLETVYEHADVRNLAVHIDRVSAERL